VIGLDQQGELTHRRQSAQYHLLDHLPPVVEFDLGRHKKQMKQQRLSVLPKRAGRRRPKLLKKQHLLGALLHKSVDQK